MQNGFGFTGSREPKERLVIPVEVDEGIYSFDDGRGYVVCERLDGLPGNHDSYMKSLKRNF